MEDNFRARLAQELNDRAEPPLGDLVPGALRQGRRIRRVRRAKLVVSTLAVVGVLTTGVTVGGHALFGGDQHRRNLPSASVVPHPTLAIVPTSTVTAPAPPSGALQPATAATVVYRLQQLVAPAPTGGYARASDGSLFGQIYVQRSDGTGMLRLSVSHGYGGVDPECGVSSPDLAEQCRSLPDGAHLTIIQIPGNCIQSLVVQVDRADGISVQLDVATCLAWNGKVNPPGVEALTTDEAIAIADDPSWGTSMDAALVTAAHTRFPNLPTFS